MPLSADPVGGGTEADGSKSTTYCSFCYRRGHFTDPSLTMAEMIVKLEPITARYHMPPSVVQATKAALPHLERWRSAA